MLHPPFQLFSLMYMHVPISSFHDILYMIVGPDNISDKLIKQFRMHAFLALLTIYMYWFIINTWETKEGRHPYIASSKNMLLHL